MIVSFFRCNYRFVFSDDWSNPSDKFARIYEVFLLPCLFVLFDIVVSVFPDDGSNLGYKSAGISCLMSWRIRGLFAWVASIYGKYRLIALLFVMGTCCRLQHL